MAVNRIHREFVYVHHSNVKSKIRYVDNALEMNTTPNFLCGRYVEWNSELCTPFRMGPKMGQKGRIQHTHVPYLPK